MAESPTVHLTIQQLARAVGKSENYVRQHVNRKHLTVHRAGRRVSVAPDEAARWARERGLPFNLPTNAWPSMTTMETRTARMTVLTQRRPGERLLNLLTVIRHRHRDTLGPWSNEPGKTWASEELGNGLQLYSMDASFEHCRGLIDRILKFAALPIDGVEIHYEIEPIPRRHRAFRDERGLADAPLRSPFSSHSAEIIEYWSFASEAKRHWLDLLDSRHGPPPLQLSRLGFPLDRLTDRVGNLMIVGAEDAISCDLDKWHDRTLMLHVDSDKLPPGAYRATVWASHSGNEMLRREVPITQGQTEVALASDVDHIGFAIFRTADGQCIDLMEAYLLKQIGGQIRIGSASTLQFHDRGGRLVHEVRPAAPSSSIDLSIDFDDAELDNKIRQDWLARRLREREATARREGNFERFGPDAFEDAVKYFAGLLSRYADQKSPIYLADPHFETHLTNDSATDLSLKKLCIDMFAATAGTPLRILCAKMRQNPDEPPPWWSSLPEQIRAHVRVRSFLSRNGDRRGFHDRYLITPRREIIVTHSLNGWQKDGVTFASLPYDVYRAEAERLWSIEPGSTTADLLVREIGR